MQNMAFVSINLQITAILDSPSMIFTGVHRVVFRGVLSFLQQYVTGESRSLFFQKASS